MTRFAWRWAAALLLTGCGTEITVYDGTGGAASSSETGDSSATAGDSGGPSGQGATATSGSGVDGCPVEEPTNGAPCSVSKEVSCTYSACCPSVWTCEGGQWSATEPPCIPPECPAELPEANAPCDCLEGLECGYDHCADGSSNANAVCSPTQGKTGAAQWIVGVAPCPPSPPCGSDGGTCLEGEICVYKGTGESSSTTCQPNPCGNGEPIDCGCAGELCDGPGMVCIGMKDAMFVCECPGCL